MTENTASWLVWLDTRDEDRFFVYRAEEGAWQGAASLVMLYLNDWIPPAPENAEVTAIRRRLKGAFLAGEYRECAEAWASWMGQFDFVAAINVLDLPPDVLLDQLETARSLANQSE